MAAWFDSLKYLLKANSRYVQQGLDHFHSHMYCFLWYAIFASKRGRSNMLYISNGSGANNDAGATLFFGLLYDHLHEIQSN